jgi:hypothetical protein
MPFDGEPGRCRRVLCVFLAPLHGRCPWVPAMIRSRSGERRPERQGRVRIAVFWLVLFSLAVPMASLPTPPARYVRRFEGPKVCSNTLVGQVSCIVRMMHAFKTHAN